MSLALVAPKGLDSDVAEIDAVEERDEAVQQSESHYRSHHYEYVREGPEQVVEGGLHHRRAAIIGCATKSETLSDIFKDVLICKLLAHDHARVAGEQRLH